MNNLKKLRGELGITQTELAKELGVTKATIINSEKNLTKKMAYKISEKYNVNVFDLLGVDILKVYPYNEEDKKKVLEILCADLEKK